MNEFEKLALLADYFYKVSNNINIGIGFSWLSNDGLKQIKTEGLHPRTEEPIFGITTDGNNQIELIPKNQIEREIKRDTQNYENRKRQQSSIENDKKSQQSLESWYGFTDNMTPIVKKRAIETLNKQMSVRSNFDSRGNHIVSLIKSGFRVENNAKYGRILTNDDGSFFLEKDLTKIGFDFAEYLQKLFDNGG